jgi:ribosomal protein S18 acetylase RimI-like enzyme
LQKLIIAQMIIRNSQRNDIDGIFNLYTQATAYQKTVNNKYWRGFEKSRVISEIDEGRHFIIQEQGEIACTFLITFCDPVIWQSAGNDPAIYLHRIATNPTYRGNSYVKKIVEWAKQYALENGKKFIRLDTHSGNPKINAYYESCGFTFVRVSKVEWNEELPEHYKEGSFSLFEIKT